MAFNLSNSSLQDISVKCVALFMNKQASLSDSVADEAKHLELNPEQIHRVIETTNTLAYLRQLKDAEDRTFEFPIAKYAEVMGKMVLPTEKQASEIDSDNSLGDSNTSIGEEQEAVISKYNLDPQEKRAMLARETLRCREVLEKMAEDKEGMAMELITLAGEVKRDMLALEKLAEVVTEDDFAPMCKLLGITKTAEDIGKEVFTNEDLNEVTTLYSLYKEAKALVDQEEELTSFVKRASNLFFTKEALTVNDAFGSVGQGLGTGLGYAVGKPVKGIYNLGKSVVLPDESKGFAATAKHQGYSSTQEAVKAYDKLKSKGTGAELHEFNGTKPSLIAHRWGVGGLAGKGMAAMAGASVNHEHNVWDELNN